jgi:uncharacterized protein (DUF2249 family)
MITGDVTVARLLDEHPELLEVLARYHPHFGTLKNTLLRRVMAPRVTVAQAARMAGVPADELVLALNRALGAEAAAHEEGAAGPVPAPARPEAIEAEKPEALARVPESALVHLDVREDIRGGREPFQRIMAAAKRLDPGQVLVLRAPFEPIPLYDVLGRRGLSHWTERRAPDDWRVWFYRGQAAPAAAAPRPEAGPGRGMVIDVRGLEPPLPMVRVLEALERLGEGETLEVLHERRPIFLYPQLEERGFVHETMEPEPGLVRIVIRRGAGA